MGRSRHHADPVTPSPSASYHGTNMIDLKAKQQTGGKGKMELTNKYREVQNRRKHESINLQINVIGSDSEDEEDDLISDDENDQNAENDQNGEQIVSNGSNVYTNNLSNDFENLSLKQERTPNKAKNAELKKKLEEIVREFELKLAGSSTPRTDLKARGPVRTLRESPRIAPFGGNRLTVTTSHGSGGEVFIKNSSTLDTFSKEQQHLLDAVQDTNFREFLLQFKPEELENIFSDFLEPEYQVAPLSPNYSVMSPQSDSNQSYTYLTSPETSPRSLDFYDSSYETGSPGSTVVTSPRSPPRHLSPPRTSVSSDSEQEPDLGIDIPSVQSINYPSPPMSIEPVSDAKVKPPQTNRRIAAKPERTYCDLKPRGEAVHIAKDSATQRLYELSKSTKFCIKHFTIELVRVVMTTKAEKQEDRIKDFTKSLMSVMKRTLVNKPHEGDIWQLSIYAHIQFLLAPARVQDYYSALYAKDERGLSIFYIAAIERFEKPVVARYIAESLALVAAQLNWKFGSPVQAMDVHGNTILHLLAGLGDSHIHVLMELLAATDGLGQPIYSVDTLNNSRQTPLHLALKSANPHFTTGVNLLNKGAHPLVEDNNELTPLHYHLWNMAKGPQPGDVELINIMMCRATCTKDSVHILDRICSDENIHRDLRSIVEKYRVKRR